MLNDFRRRFATLLQPDVECFNPIPAAACVLDLTVAPILLAPEYAALLFAAKMYVVSVNEKISNGDGGAIPLPDDSSCMFIDAKSAVIIQSCQVFEFQDSSHKRVVIDTNCHQDTILSQLNHYLTDVCEEHVDDGLAFWARELPRYNKLSDLVKT
jgi:hypothetical protein